MEVKSEPEDCYNFAQTSKIVSSLSAHNPTLSIKTEDIKSEITSTLFNEDESQPSALLIKQEELKSDDEDENVSTYKDLTETFPKCDDVIKPKRYSCSLCEYTTDRNQSAFVHSKTHKRISYFKCSKCVLMKVNNEEMLFRCPTCITPPKRNTEEIHSKDKFFYCNSCGFKAAGQFNFQMLHEFVCHKVEKPFTCPSCNYNCATQSALTDHLVKHVGENPFPCSTCRYRTNSQENLEAHILTHKPFCCTMCDYRCATQSTLNMHLRTHKRKGQLEVHVPAHKPFFCTMCDSRCATQSELNRHLRTHERKDHLKRLVEKKVYKVYNLDQLQTVKIDEVCINKEF